MHQEAILKALTSAHTHVSSIGDFSDQIESLQRMHANYDLYWNIKCARDNKKRFHQSPWGSTFVSHVGRQLPSSVVLDVGSGKSSTFKNLIIGRVGDRI